MELKEKKALVIGLGRTGEALCDYLLSRGAFVTVSDRKSPEELGPKLVHWKEKGVKIKTGAHDLGMFLEADLIVPSPGVPILPEIEAAQKKGIAVLSEVELAYRFLKGKIVGITGSNGKSTTTSLVHKILTEGGLNSHLAGNIGTPLISFVSKSKNDHIYATELSSFQLALVEQFRAAVSILLNITPDHLDWHHTFNNYCEAKKNLLRTQTKKDTVILNQDDALVWALKDCGASKPYAFSQTGPVSRGSYIQDGWIMLNVKKAEKLMKIEEIPLLGAHNRDNIMAAAITGRLLGIPISSIKKSIRSFEGLEHRLKKVDTVRDIDFYNDSKATNVDAALKSIESLEQEIILILGGRDKGGDFSKLIEPIQKKVRKVILVGEASEKIYAALKNVVPMEQSQSIAHAVELGFHSAEPGDAVLLAPACTSWDMFQNFEERGETFIHDVEVLKASLEKTEEP